MAYQFNQNQNNNNNQSGQVPPPSQPGSVDIRTQQSDINSIKQSGGASSPEPKQFDLGANNNVTPSSPLSPSAPQPTSTPPANVPSAPSGQGGDNEPVFDPNQTSQQGGEGKKMDIKKIALISIATLIVIILGWIGYAYVYPIFFSSITPPVVLNENVNNNTNNLEEVIPAEVEEPITDTNTEEVINPINQPLIDYTGISGSYNVSLDNLLNDLIGLSGLPVYSQENNFNRVIINKGDVNTPQEASFADFLNILGLNEVTAQDFFESSLDSFLFYDEDENLAIGYVGKIKEDISPTDAREFIKNIENSDNINAIFTSNPLVPNIEGFKDGQVNSVPNRYLSYSNGKSFSYFWSGNHLVITTSYNAAKFIEPKIIN